LDQSDLEREMQRHLKEPRTSNGVLNDAKVATRRTGIGVGRSSDAWIEPGIHLVVDRRIAEKWIELDIVVGDIEAWMVEDVECLHVVSQIEAVIDFEILKNS
jgi:hypothetical protein